MNLDQGAAWFHHVATIPLFSIGATQVTMASAALFILIVIATLVISAVAQRALAKALQLRRITDPGALAVSRRLLQYFILLVGLGIALQVVGISLSTLFAAGAVFAIGIGFAMQNIVQNFVSGVILLVERTITPGDVLQVEGRIVKVRKMGIRATIARTLDDEEIIVPNSMLVQSAVTNYTLSDSYYRLRNSVGVVYDADMALVRSTLEQVARTLPLRAQDKEPMVLMTEFGDSAVIYEVSIWIDDPWHRRRASSDLNEAIWWAFKEHGIVIAFPQVDVHFDAPINELPRLMAQRAG